MDASLSPTRELGQAEVKNKQTNNCLAWIIFQASEPSQHYKGPGTTCSEHPPALATWFPTKGRLSKNSSSLSDWFLFSFTTLACCLTGHETAEKPTSPQSHVCTGYKFVSSARNCWVLGVALRSFSGKPSLGGDCLHLLGAAVSANLILNSLKLLNLTFFSPFTLKWGSLHLRNCLFWWNQERSYAYIHK